MYVVCACLSVVCVHVGVVCVGGVHMSKDYFPLARGGNVATHTSPVSIEVFNGAAQLKVGEVFAEISIGYPEHTIALGNVQQSPPCGFWYTFPLVRAIGRRCYSNFTFVSK